MLLSICAIILVGSIMAAIIEKEGSLLGIGVMISVFGAALFVLIPLTGYSLAERSALDDRFVVTYQNDIKSVTFTPADNKYIVEIGEGSTYTVDKVSKITDSTDQKVFKGYQKEVPWVLVPYPVTVSHEDVYLFPLDKIEVAR